MLQCSRCSSIFSSGMAVSNGGTIIIRDCFAQCPKCGSIENIPDGTFKETVEGIARLLQKSQNPLKEVGEILSALEAGRSQGSVLPLLSKPWYILFKKWLPDTPEKIAAYVGIFGVIYQFLMKDPSVHIEYSPTFIDQYNQTIIYTQPTRQMDSKKRRSTNDGKGFAQYSQK